MVPCPGGTRRRVPPPAGRFATYRLDRRGRPGTALAARAATRGALPAAAHAVQAAADTAGTVTAVTTAVREDARGVRRARDQIAYEVLPGLIGVADDEVDRSSWRGIGIKHLLFPSLANTRHLPREIGRSARRSQAQPRVADHFSRSRKCEGNMRQQAAESSTLALADIRDGPSDDHQRASRLFDLMGGDSGRRLVRKRDEPRSATEVTPTPDRIRQRRIPASRPRFCGSPRAPPTSCGRHLDGGTRRIRRTGPALRPSARGECSVEFRRAAAPPGLALEANVTRRSPSGRSTPPYHPHRSPAG